VQPTEGAEQDQRPILRRDGIGQLLYLGGERNRISFRSILGKGTRRHGVCGIMPASTAAAMTLLRSW
jgi:hypothetical protein